MCGRTACTDRWGAGGNQHQSAPSARSQAPLAYPTILDSHVWSPTVYFCDPWPWAFGLLGLNGLDPFLMTINAYEEWVELKPH